MSAAGKTVVAVVVLCGVFAAGAAASSGLVGFHSPSGNIGCYMDRSHARCDIDKRDWSPPPKPSSCPFEWGQGLIVDKRGKARFVCAGDTAFGGERTLGYGESIQRGRFRCKSKMSGMRCVNTRNGHGFKLSRQLAKRF